MPGGCSNAIVAKAALAAGGFNSQYKHFADWDLWIRLARAGPPSLVSAPLVGYRIHAGNKSLDMSGMMADLDLLQRRYRTTIDRGSFHHYLSWLCLRAGKRHDAVKHFLQAVAYGEVLPVAGDLWLILRSRLARRFSSRPLFRPPEQHPKWRDAAEAWLVDFKRAAASWDPTGTD